MEYRYIAGFRGKRIMGQSDKRQEDFWFTLLRREEERALWHPELELIFVLKGTGRVCLMQNGPVYRINEGDIFAGLV